ncbi:DUF6304 family protein [Dictyobacter kobayashii]|uniref:Uncharacterized protein n=1 Tax=Dictyobacter kobayashii TaxID=2014872 RepID=A0A402AP72_9CHLR|nr:DUF6304 family protein [Dictyobacter kobayashii]GCE20917.1 hypothetical protein KDK_47170 [Dictyobacter kobayashii]
MFAETYPALYRDPQGEVSTTIRNDGKKLRMVLRDVEFISTMFDDWMPTSSVDALALQSFTLDRGELRGFSLEVDMPIPMLFQKEKVQGILHISFVLGVPTSNGGTDREIVALTLNIMNTCFSSQGKSGYFEDELLDLQKQLPNDVTMQICFSCAFSDYSPYGNGLFGCMACFRGNKQVYLAAQTKRDILDLWDTHTEYVQETYRCDEFELRKPGTGYRG